jgi:hypothetical protein
MRWLAAAVTLASVVVVADCAFAGEKGPLEECFAEDKATIEACLRVAMACSNVCAESTRTGPEYRECDSHCRLGQERCHQDATREFRACKREVESRRGAQ